MTTLDHMLLLPLDPGASGVSGRTRSQRVCVGMETISGGGGGALKAPQQREADLYVLLDQLILTDPHRSLNTFL